MLAPSDRSRFASYLAVITSYEVIIAGVLNRKVAASRFVNVSAEVVNVLEENTIAKSTKFAIEFDGTLFKREKLTMIRIITTIIAIHNLQQNSKDSSQLYHNNDSPQAQ